jgi:hypothetical protein
VSNIGWESVLGGDEMRSVALTREEFLA